jgi:hypothetical protein
MPTENNNNVEENYCHYYNSNSDNDNRAYNIKDNEQSGNVNWWINELDSLGIKKNNDINIVRKDQNISSDKAKPVKSQQLEDLTDDIKQSFIHDYKAYVSLTICSRLQLLSI